MSVCVCRRGRENYRTMSGQARSVIFFFFLHTSSPAPGTPRGESGVRAGFGRQFPVRRLYRERKGGRWLDHRSQGAPRRRARAVVRGQRRRRRQGNRLAICGGGWAAVVVRSEGDGSEAEWPSGGDLGAVLRMTYSVSVRPRPARAACAAPGWVAPPSGLAPKPAPDGRPARIPGPRACPVPGGRRSGGKPRGRTPRERWRRAGPGRPEAAGTQGRGGWGGSATRREGAQ